jgi:hypothetical protein
LTTVENQTPGDTDEQLCIKAPAGTVIYFVLPQLEESPICTSPIPNKATAATATRAADIMTTTHTPRDGEGSLECGLTPEGWQGGQGVDAFIPVTRSGGTSRLVRYGTPDGGTWETVADGTHNVDPGVVLIDGTRNLVRVRWGDNGLSCDVDGTRASDGYDGSLQASGAVKLRIVKLGTDAPGELLVDSLRIFRGESG